MSVLDLATGDLNSDSVIEKDSGAAVTVLEYCLYVVTFCWSAKLVKVGGACLHQEACLKSKCNKHTSGNVHVDCFA